MARRAPIKDTAKSDKTARLGHLVKMSPKVKRAVQADVNKDRDEPVAEVEGQPDFQKVYRRRGEGYGQDDVEDVYRAYGKG